MLYRGLILVCALVLSVTGCTNVPHSTGGPPPDVMVVSDDNATAVEPQLTPPPKNQPAQASTPAPAQIPAPSVSIPAAASHLKFIAGTWIPLEQWCRINGFGSVRESVNGKTVTCAFATTHGDVTVRIGSQIAFWNGLEIQLGFAPQIVNGQPLMHDLDLRKNLAPLLDEAARVNRHPVLVIDPGHGGTDTGTRNIVNGHYEKEFTLDWAMRLQSILVSNGWTVWLTRTNDVNLPLPARVAIASQHNADLFLSLHFNSSFPDREQSGLETYCLTPSGMPSNLTRGYVDNPQLVFPNNTFDTENLQLAMHLHGALLAVNGHGDRGVRRARFLGVLQGQSRPAALVEGAYLSNPREARQIADPAHRQRLAEALARALMDSTAGAAATHAALPARANPSADTQRAHAE